MNKEEFLKLAEAKYAEIHALKEKPTFLDYEQGFVELWTELGRQVLLRYSPFVGQKNDFFKLSRS